MFISTLVISYDPSSTRMHPCSLDKYKFTICPSRFKLMPYLKKFHGKLEPLSLFLDSTSRLNFNSLWILQDIIVIPNSSGIFLQRSYMYVLSPQLDFKQALCFLHLQFLPIFSMLFSFSSNCLVHCYAFNDCLPRK